MEINHRIISLIAKSIDSTLTAAEQEELDAWISSSPQNRAFYLRTTNKKYVAKKMRRIYAVNKKAAWKSFVANDSSGVTFKKPFIKRRKAILIPIGILVVLITFCLFYVAPKRKTATCTTTTSNDTPQKPQAAGMLNDIFPLIDKATLFLQNGFKAQLDTCTGQTITPTDSVQLQNIKPGLLAIRSAYQNHINEANNEFESQSFALSNVITTPRDGQWVIILADSTVVWLNASSQLTFPLRFNDTQRRVLLSGEAYFKVRQKRSANGQNNIPFVVEVNGVQVLVTGTEFNITAYDNKKPVTTLVQGKVELINGNEKKVLHPGQQATINAGQFALMNDAPVDEIIAWKDKGIVLKDASIEQVMDKIKRLYNVEVKYEAEISAHFKIYIQSNTPLSKALEDIAFTGEVKFSINDRTITVTK